MTKLILLFSPVFSYIEIFTKHHGVLKIDLRIIGRLNEAENRFSCYKQHKK